MYKYQNWKLLKETTKAAKKDREQQLDNIISINMFDKSCIQVYPYNIFEIPAETNIVELSISYCDNFSDKPCGNKNCPMNPMNHEYYEANTIYQLLKKSRNRAF